MLADIAKWLPSFDREGRSVADLKRRALESGFQGLNKAIIESYTDKDVEPITPKARIGTCIASAACYRTTWAAKLQGLFALGDDFDRKWDTNRQFRRELKEYRDLIGRVVGGEAAVAFEEGLGLHATRYLYGIPRYTGEHIYSRKKLLTQKQRAKGNRQQLSNIERIGWLFGI